MTEMGKATQQSLRVIGGLTVVSGGLTVTAGGITVTAGDLTMTAGDIALGANKLKTTNLSLYESSSVLKVRNAAGSADAALSAAALTLSGNLSIGANLLKTTNLALKETSTTSLSVRDDADTGDLDLYTRICFSQDFRAANATGLMKTEASGTAYLDMQSHSGSAYVSCIKLVGGVAEIAAAKLTARLNCNTQSLDYVVDLNMSGLIDMSQIAKPANPSAGKVRIYPKDKGSDITGLFVLFDDGTEVEIATEV